MRRPSGSTTLGRAAHRTGRLLGRLDVLTARIPSWAVLSPLTVGSWLVALVVAHIAIHTGWLYYNGGDSTWYYTSAWTLGHGHIPYSSIGYAYSMMLAPFALVAGPSMLAGLPYAIIFNVLVLGSIAVFCTYGIAKMIGGQRFAYLVSLLWILAPLLAIPYFDPRYHRRYVGETLPAVLGLTTLGDFPSMVALLVAAYFALRTVMGGRGLDALTSGLAAGLAIAIKPANGTFVPALFVGFLLARRPRSCLLAIAGIAPAILCLALWKERGLGYLPLVHSQAQALALGTGRLPVGLAVHTSKYLPFSWTHLAQNIDGLREFTWSKRLIEWSVVGGLIALGRRSLAAAGFVGAWLALYVVLKGGSVANVNGGSFFRYLAPAFPAAFLLAVSIPLLIPIAGRKLAATGRAAVRNGGTWPRSERARRTVLGIAAFLSVGPLIPILAFPQQNTANAADFPSESQYVPINGFALHASVDGRNVHLTWPSRSFAGTRVKYEVFRSPADLLTCGSTGGALQCIYSMEPTHAVGRAAWSDRPPQAGHWVYRVVVAAGVPPPAGIGTAIEISKPLDVDVR